MTYLKFKILFFVYQPLILIGSSINLIPFTFIRILVYVINVNSFVILGNKSFSEHNKNKRDFTVFILQFRGNFIIIIMF
jgi:hypothetical protein